MALSGYIISSTIHQLLEESNYILKYVLKTMLKAVVGRTFKHWDQLGYSLLMSPA